MEDTQRLIVRQVAFKGALEVLPDHVVWKHETEPSADQLVRTVKWLTDEFEKIILSK